MESGGVENGFVQRISGEGSKGFAAYYLSAVAFTLLMLGSGFVATREPWLLIPIVAFLVSSMCAMVFAVMAARPHVQRSRVTRDGLLAGQGNLLYFNNFNKMSSHEYVRTLEGMLGDSSRIYNQMARTVYGLSLIHI